MENDKYPRQPRIEDDAFWRYHDGESGNQGTGYRDEGAFAHAMERYNQQVVDWNKRNSLKADKFIRIERYEQPQVRLFNPDGHWIGTINNEIEFNKVRIQIAKQNLSGYYVIFKDEKLEITNMGKVLNWPDGFYDEASHTLSEIFRVERDKHMKAINDKKIEEHKAKTNL